MAREEISDDPTVAAVVTAAGENDYTVGCCIAKALEDQRSRSLSGARHQVPSWCSAVDYGALTGNCFARAGDSRSHLMDGRSERMRRIPGILAVECSLEIVQAGELL